MKIIRLTLFICIFIILTSGMSGHNFSAYGEQLDGKDEKNINFHWAFCSLTKAAAGPEIEVIRRDKILRSGDKIKFFIKLESKCFVYLIYKDSQGELSVLFPHRFNLLGSEHNLSENQYIPKGNLWFELDEKTGFEKYYLLASANRLRKLEILLNEYESAGRKQKSELTEKIIAEIKRLKRKHKKFQAAAERPVSIGGTVRGTGSVDDVASTAVAISASEFFSRTFTIEHR